MDRYGAAIRRLVELVPGVAVTLALIWLAPPISASDAELQVSIGVTVSLLGVVLVDGSAFESLLNAYRDDVRSLNAMVGDRMTSDALSRAILELGTTEIPGSEFERFYLNALWSVEHSYVTTFVATDTSANEGHNHMALEIQRTKVRVAGADIRRLFVFADESQHAAHQVMMRDHLDAGIRVRYLLTEQVHSDRVIQIRLARLGSLDFSIIDGDIVLRTVLATRDGRNVAVERTMVNRNPGLTKDFGFFFSLLWEQGLDVSGS